MTHLHPAVKSGWTRIGIHLLENLPEQGQEACREIGGQFTKETQNKYLLFENLGQVTATGDRPLVYMYQRFKPRNKKGERK